MLISPHYPYLLYFYLGDLLMLKVSHWSTEIPNFEPLNCVIFLLYIFDLCVNAEETDQGCSTRTDNKLKRHPAKKDNYTTLFLKKRIFIYIYSECDSAKAEKDTMSILYWIPLSASSQ